ncbi:hypothetical protein EK21DRAFT_77318 [Setomelanomma holmii]|uniref:Uncharacterized protein n=1 Tax=Setomelanomma holmii TaxID=210430 RepID=A0A9P4GY47_9PLEO|nr:hypothetical protein EK21DRAFT_77318 [Setomelanomma holmii]
MPDNKGVGWRKKIQSKPKELQPLKIGTEETVTVEEASDRRRHHGWRKTIQGSRPATPVGVPATPTVEDTDEARAERIEAATPRRDSKPKLNRYTSLFSSFKDTLKGPDFSEPWNDERPELEPYVDPELAIQAVRSHMVSYSMKPIPIDHNSALFRIFEAYHKLRAENEHLEAAIESTGQELDSVKERWAREERRYAEEIHRLELLIAQGVSGVAGVLHARQGSVVDRKRMHRKTISNDRGTTWQAFLTQEQVDDEIKLRSQRVLLHRPTSPSGKMAALSRQFTGKASADLRVGTPPGEDKTLSRKVQSELNLAKLSRMDTIPSVTDSSFTSGFSGGPGDPLPDELSTLSPERIATTIECDAFVALRELGALVARRRGLNIDSFVHELMGLFSGADSDAKTGYHEETDLAQETAEEVLSVQGSYVNEVTPKRILRRFQSQPQLASDQNRRRHFSFEPGEDHLQALREEMNPFEPIQPCNQPYDLVSSTSSSAQGTNTKSSCKVATPPYQALSPGAHCSKIPSPVALYGSPRRESSVSSLQSTLTRSNDGRHNSQSSIVTAFREHQGGTLFPGSSSRSSSFNNLRNSEASPSPKDRPSSIRVRNSVASLAAIRATEQANIVARSGSSSPGKCGAKVSVTESQTTRRVGQLQSENSCPNRSDGGGSR